MLVCAKLGLVRGPFRNLPESIGEISLAPEVCQLQL